MYDPRDGRARVVADMGVATGEKGKGLVPQGKIHTHLGHGSDGRVYFATHPTFPPGDIKADYPAGQFMVYCRGPG